MLSEFDLIFAVALVISWTCGTVLNSSIVAVYLSDWKKGLNLGACDQIILTMGCNNLLLQWFLTLNLIFVVYGLYSLLAKVLLVAVVSLVLNFGIAFSFWLTAWLSSYYCVKLVNFSNRFFIRLKREASGVVTYCLLGTAVILFSTRLPIIWSVQITTDQNLTRISNVLYDNIVHLSFNTIFIYFLPTIITSFCIGLSLMSLLKHVRKMKQNTSQFWNPQLKSHIKACRTMFLLLTVNLIFFLSISIFSMLFSKTEGTGQYVTRFIMLLNPSSQAIILLFGTSRLATAWSKVLVYMLRASHTSQLD
uniref:Taste receptor type 2 n=1 Tax=Xenopus tropicalis TaxID=8364 RepID=A0A6I8PSM4_XENTR